MTDEMVIDNRIGPNFGKPLIHRECSAQFAAERSARAKLVEAGQDLSGQVLTSAIQHHVRDKHLEVFDGCGNGTCRSSQKHLLAWEQARALLDQQPGLAAPTQEANRKPPFDLNGLPTATDETICARCGERGHWWCHDSRMLVKGRAPAPRFPDEYYDEDAPASAPPAPRPDLGEREA